MNIKTKVNSVLLGRYLNEVKIPPLECVDVGFWNLGKGREQSRVFLYFMIPAILLSIISEEIMGNMILTIVMGIVIIILMRIYAIECRKESKIKQILEKGIEIIRRREIVMEEIFSDYVRVRDRSKEICKTDQEAWSLVLDSVRSEILDLVMMVEEKHEDMRGELRIKFRVAKKFFGDDLDLGHGYDDFFSREILRNMDHFKGSHSETK